MRRTIDFNQDWTFFKHKDENGISVTLPHTWNAEDGMDGGNDYFRGTCRYVKKCSRPSAEKDERVFLEIPAAAMTADVFLNGKHLAHHEGGYSLFRVDLTDGLQDENVLSISCDNAAGDHVYPQKADFTFYGGLYRGARLLIVPKVHFALMDSGSPGIYVKPEIHLSADGTSADIFVQAKTDSPVTGEKMDKSGYRVVFSLDGQIRSIIVQDGCADAVFHLPSVHLWNGIEDPYLYTVTARLIASEEDLSDTLQKPDTLFSGDQVSVRFGCRSFRVDPQEGFILNGRSYPLRGVSRHQDREGYGNALTAKMHREDMELIREIGANTVRLAHYQHSQEFYDLCDECGMIVWAEIPYISVHMPEGRENTISQMRELVMQNRNHPSIICWGLSNEITAGSAVNEDMLENHRALNDLCHQLDAMRPTSMANVFMLETDSPILGIPDINSYNLYFGWYLGELKQNEQFFDSYHKKYPDRVIGFSEYGAECNVKFQTCRPECGDYSEQYQCLYHEHMLKMFETRPYLWATHVWNMFDFGSDGKDEGGKHGYNQKGLVTADRKIKKDAFYLYKAYWSREPFVHLCGSRYIDRTGDMTEIKVYSNQPAVTLFIDGTEKEKKNGEHVFIFRVPVTGEHLIEATAGEWKDSIRIRRAEKANEDYIFSGGAVTNWLNDISIDDRCYSINDSLGILMQNPQTAAIVGQIMSHASKSRGEVAEATKDNPALKLMMAAMPLKEMLKRAGDAVGADQVRSLNSALQRIAKK